MPAIPYLVPEFVLVPDKNSVPHSGVNFPLFFLGFAHSRIFHLFRVFRLFWFSGVKIRNSGFSVFSVFSAFRGSRPGIPGSRLRPRFRGAHRHVGNSSEFCFGWGGVGNGIKIVLPSILQNLSADKSTFFENTVSWPTEVTAQTSHPVHPGFGRASSFAMTNHVLEVSHPNLILYITKHGLKLRCLD